MTSDQSVTKTDFLGNTYGPGDTIVYAAMSGRCVNMVKAEVVSIKETGSVVVQPLASSRWKQHRVKTWYVDNRTEKKIDRWNAKHVKTHAHYVDPVTGIKYDYDGRAALYDRAYAPRGGWSYGPRQVRDQQALDAWNRLMYVGTEFNDYVEERSDEKPRAVTLTVTENIVLLERKVVDETTEVDSA